MKKKITIAKSIIISLIMFGSVLAQADILTPIAVSDAASTVALKKEAQSVGPDLFTSSDYKPGLLHHMVLFRYKADVTQVQKEQVKQKFLDLANLCVRDGDRYITSIETGVQNSGEGADQGLEQGFIVTLRSRGDRNFYVGGPIIDTSTPDLQKANSAYFDPHHQAFKAFVGPLLDGVIVFDMTIQDRQ